jgi:chromosome segregation ATPase
MIKLDYKLEIINYRNRRLGGKKMILTISGTALLIIGLVTAGTALLTGGHVVGSNISKKNKAEKAAAEEEKANAPARIAELEEEVRIQRVNYSTIESTITELTSAGGKIEDAHTLFLEGGHVYQGKALAETQITNCKSAIESTKTYLDNYLTDIDNNITIINAEITRLKNL